MKGDTILEYAELQLVQPLARCDVFVSANGVSEKLASGFVKPFLMHLRVVGEQVAHGFNTVRLHHPKTLQGYLGRSWFTKGTWERFVRFVSTPEVLERINSLEDELAQLEQVRNIQASSLVQGAGSATTKADGLLEKDGHSRYDCANSDADFSRIELLKAMDVRLHALAQEQSTAFQRAAAVGFSIGNTTDLIAFAEHFGAERLRTACTNFLAILQSKCRASAWSADFEAASGSSARPLCTVKGLDSVQSDAHLAQYPFDGRPGIASDEPLLCPGEGTEFDNTRSRGGGGFEARKRWGPPENIRTDLYSYQNDTNSTSSNNTSNGMSINGSPEVQSGISKSQLASVEEEKQHDGGFPLGDTRTSSTSLQPFVKENNSTSVSSFKASEELQNSMDSESLSSSTPTFVRRLSVQDAISLFEKKQGRDSIDSSVKQRSGKPVENGRASLDGTNEMFLDGASVVSSGGMPVRRWNAVSGVKEGNEVQGKEPVASSTQYIRDEATSSFSSATTININDPLSAFPGRVADQPLLPGVLLKSVNTTIIQPSALHATRMAEVAPGMQSFHPRLDNDALDGADGAHEGAWQKQFNLELKRSLGKEPVLPGQHGPPGLEPGKSFSKYSQKSSIPSFEIPMSENRIKDRVEKFGLSKESRQIFPVQNAGPLQVLSVAYSEAIEWRTDPNTMELLSSSKVKEEVTDAIHINGKESFGSSSADMQALVTRADNNTAEDERLKGRFYEQYKKLRDAKLMEGQDCKRAEREAKLRVMEETLTKRKAELDARAARLTRNSHQSHMRASKFNATKMADLSTPRKEQQVVRDEGVNFSSRDQSKTTVSSSSAPITPYATSKEGSTSKPQGGRISGAVLPKGATPPRGSGRATPSVSPKLTPKSKTVATPGNLRRSVATDNPLARSVPCFANLRKENTKPSPVRPSGSARIHSKNLGPGRDGAPLEANANLPIRVRNGVQVKDDKNLWSGPMRKSYATASDLKMLSSSSNDGVLAPLRGQREIRNQPSAQSKVRRSVAGPLQEAKPFLKKGRSSGQGATGPRVVKQKGSFAADTVKSSDEDAIAPNNAKESSNTDGTFEVLEGVPNVHNVRGCQEVENMDIEEEDDSSADLSSTKHKEQHPMAALPKELVDGEVDPLRVDIVDDERTCHTISFPIDGEAHDRYAVEFGSETDSNLVFDPDALSLKVEYIEDLSRVAHDITEPLENPCMAALVRASSLPHEQIGPALSPAATSLPSSSLVHCDHLSPWHAVVPDSPLASPGTFISSRSQLTNDIRISRKWVASDKAALPSQSKEPARGFKRLLKFARMGRTSEFSTSDCISASNTSEGDDELEVQSRFVDEVSYRNMQERGIDDVSGNQYQEKGAGVRSSIPTPPPNFRLQDDHMSRDSLVKAPRSFFSLSSFRGKGSDGKMR